MMHWSHEYPKNPGFHLRMKADGRVVLHRVWSDESGLLMIWWEGAIAAVDDVAKKLSWYYWHPTGIVDLPPKYGDVQPETSVAANNYDG